jgi:hypothetical protein
MLSVNSSGLYSQYLPCDIFDIIFLKCNLVVITVTDIKFMMHISITLCIHVHCIILVIIIL